jgi:hypothetical protein
MERIGKDKSAAVGLERVFSAAVSFRAIHHTDFFHSHCLMQFLTWESVALGCCMLGNTQRSLFPAGTTDQTVMFLGEMVYDTIKS